MQVPGNPNLERWAVQCTEYKLGIRRRWLLVLSLPPVYCVSGSYSCSSTAYLCRGMLREEAVWHGRNCKDFGDHHPQVRIWDRVFNKYVLLRNAFL